jgi:hypothetical protein
VAGIIFQMVVKSGLTKIQQEIGMSKLNLNWRMNYLTRFIVNNTQP